MSKLIIVTLIALLPLLMWPAAAVGQAADKAPKKYSANEALNAVLWMHQAAEYKALCLQAYNIARVMLTQALADKNWSADLVQQKQGGYQHLPAAAIVDVDETVLDNGIYQRQLVLTGKPYTSSSWSKWCQQEKAGAIAGALDFCNYAQQKGVTIFYVTNRRHYLQKVTAKNLQALGFPLKKGEQCILPRTIARNKSQRRQIVAQKYRILLLIGDNNCDFSGDFQDKNSGEREKIARKYAGYWGTRWIVLPNPAYGDWEGAVLDYNFRLAPNARWQKKYQALEE